MLLPSHESRPVCESTQLALKKDIVIKRPEHRSFLSGLLPLFVAAHFVHHLLPALLVPLSPFIRNDFSLDYTRSAMVLSAFNWSYGISQIPAGRLADRIDRRIPMVIGICGVGLAGVLVGLSQTYTMLIVFLVLMGVLGGGYHPSATPMVSALVESKKRGRILGIHEIGGGASFFVVPLVAAAIATAWGWRGSFIGLAIPPLIFGVIFYSVLGRRAAISRTDPKTIKQHEEAAPQPGYLRRLVALMILSVGTGGVVASVVAFLPLYMVDHFGASEQTAASLMAIYYSAGVWASPLGGHISDRLGRVPVLVVNSLIAAAAIYLLNIASYGMGIFALLCIIGITTFVRLPVSEAYIIGQTTERNRSTVYGIYYFSMTESGAVLAPIMGLIVDHFGFHNGFIVATVAIVAVVLACSPFLRGSQD
jgi:FSR family fosmidomycin resistance protein-like MFS transporter